MEPPSSLRVLKPSGDYVAHDYSNITPKHDDPLSFILLTLNIYVLFAAILNIEIHISMFMN